MEKDYKVLPVVSFVLGIISVLSILFYYISIPTSILAIIFGILSRRRSGSKLGLTGMILGIVGLSLCILIYILFVTIILIAA